MTQHPSDLTYALGILREYLGDVDSHLTELETNGGTASILQQDQLEAAWDAVDAVAILVSGAHVFRDETLAEFPEEFYGDSVWGKEPHVCHVSRAAVDYLIDWHGKPEALLQALRDGRALIDFHLELPSNTLSVDIRTDDPELKLVPWLRFKNGVLRGCAVIPTLAFLFIGSRPTDLRRATTIFVPAVRGARRAGQFGAFDRGSQLISSKRPVHGR